MTRQLGRKVRAGVPTEQPEESEVPDSEPILELVTAEKRRPFTCMLHVDVVTGEVLSNRLAEVIDPVFAEYSRFSAYRRERDALVV